MTRRLSAFLMVVACIAAGPALAQATGTPLRGTIETVGSGTMSIDTSDGQHLTVSLPADLRVQTLTAIALSDIKPGDYVGATAKTGADGTLTATQVNVIPAAAGGAGDGQRPIGTVAGTTMNNGTVSGVAASSDGQVLKLSVKTGQTVDIDVPPSVPVQTFVAGDQSQLKPGLAIMVFATKNPDGTLTASGILAGNGARQPPA